MSHLSLEEHPIVHPSWQDNGHMDNAVGQVVESFCGNYGLCQTGLDFALVRILGCREEGIFLFGIFHVLLNFVQL